MDGRTARVPRQARGERSAEHVLILAFDEDHLAQLLFERESGGPRQARRQRGDDVSLQLREPFDQRLQLARSQDEHFRVLGGSYGRRGRFAREQRHLPDRLPDLDACHDVLDATAVGENYLGGALAQNVHLAAGITRREDYRPRAEPASRESRKRRLDGVR